MELPRNTLQTQWHEESGARFLHWSYRNGNGEFFQGRATDFSDACSQASYFGFPTPEEAKNVCIV